MVPWKGKKHRKLCVFEKTVDLNCYFSLCSQIFGYAYVYNKCFTTNRYEGCGITISFGFATRKGKSVDSFHLKNRTTITKSGKQLLRFKTRIVKTFHCSTGLIPLSAVFISFFLASTDSRQV